MGTVYYEKLIEGVTVPAIIHNYNYFLIQMAVYEDGTVSCWKRSDLVQFQSDLENGWVVPTMPKGKSLSVDGLGHFSILEARWKHDAESYYHYIEDTVRTLNPEMTNLYRTTQRELDKWKKAHVSFMADPIPFKLEEGYGYNLLDGENCYIFYWKDGKQYLTPLMAYEDKTIKIDAAGDCYYTIDEINDLFKEGILCTVPKEQEWVDISGLGEVLLTSPLYGKILAEEKQKEIVDMIARATGAQDSLDRCRKAHYQYLCEPNNYNREELRKAYEAVPEHQRIYLGTMDTKDHDFRHILFPPEQ